MKEGKAVSQPRWVKPLGRRLQKLMDEHDWSQETVMRNAIRDVSTKTVSNILRGRDGYADYAPSGKSIRAVFSAFGDKGVEALRLQGLDDQADLLEKELGERTIDANIEQIVRQVIRDHRDEVEKWMR